MIRKLSLVVLVPLFWLSTAHAGKSIVVDLSTQTATAYENDVPIFGGHISTGTAKRPTPTGRFRVLEKDIDHVSSSWPKPNGGAKMHYMLRLTNYGIAMHLGYVPSYPASHGCIRLQNGFAQKMYRWAHVGVPVRVIGHAPARVYRPVVKTARRAKSPRRKIKQSVARQRPKVLDTLSSSPKAAKRLKKEQEEKWKKAPKRKSPRVDPLKAMRA
jgi:hypothetical protein